MTVSTTASEAAFPGNGVTTVFPLGFEVREASDLVVSVIQTNGSISPLTLNVHYTVSDLGNEAGATVTMTRMVETGETLLTRRATERTQPISLLPASGFSPRAVEDALDRMAMIVQEAGSLDDRALRAPVGEVIAALPAILQRSGKVLGFDSNGAPIAVTALDQQLVSSLWATILLASTVSQARQELFVPAYVRNHITFDFNTLGAGAGSTTTGIYATGAGSTGLPGGEDGAGGHLVALNYNSDVDEGQQLYLAPSGRLYIRGRTGGTFGAWARIYSTGDIDHARSSLGIGMVPIVKKTASASASLDFTEFDASRFDSYVFVLQNLRPANDNVEFFARLSNNGGSSYNAGGSDYSWTSIGLVHDASPLSKGASVGDSAVRVAQTGVGNGANEGVNGTVRLFAPGEALRTRMTFDVTVTNQTGPELFMTGSGVRLAAQADNAIRFLFSTGNVGSGSIIMYGLRTP